MRILRNALFSLTLLGLCYTAYSQSYLLGYGAVDLGFLQSATFQNGTLNHRTSTLTGFDFGLEYRFRNVFALEAGIGQYFEKIRLQDPQFEEDYSAHSLVYNQKSAYLSYHGAVQFFVPIKWSTWLYGKCYYSVPLDRAETVYESYDYEILKSEVQHTIVAESNFGNRNNAFVPEIGIQSRLDNGTLLSFGMQMNFSQRNLVSGKYELFDRDNGQLLRAESFNSNGNNFNFNFKANVPIHEFVKRERKKPVDKPEDPIDDDLIVSKEEKKKEEKKTKTPEAKIVKNKSGEPTELNERTIIKTKTIHVKVDTILLKVWDNGAHVDGDSVSINLNGEWILTDYRLKRKQLEIKVPLERRSDNYLVLYALNLGTSPPNTAAVIVYDGKMQKIMRLSSDMKTCGAINIINR